MVYILRFFPSSECSLFHNYNVFGSCIIHILYTGVPKLKKNNSSAKKLKHIFCVAVVEIPFILQVATHKHSINNKKLHMLKVRTSAQNINSHLHIVGTSVLFRKH